MQNPLFPGSVVEVKSDLTLQPLPASGAGSASDQEEVDASKVLRELWWCEHILATEHVEWLRLMMEAEWYG